MKKTKIKAIAAALLVSMSVSALAIPSYARPIGDGLTLPEDGVVTYDFNTNENPFEEHMTDKTVTESANGTPNTVLEIGGTQNYVFQIGKGERNIYTPKHWETDYVKKSMSVRINNSGLKSTGNMSWQRIILWYENETNWLGLDWKISDGQDSNIGDYTYDTKIVAMNSNLTSIQSSTAPTVLEKWADLTNGTKMPVGEKSDWLHLDVAYTEKGKIALSWYKEKDSDKKYTNNNITTNGFDAYDINTGNKVDTSTYFADYDLRKGLFGIAGVNYNTNVGYYDDLTVTLDVDSAKAINFKNDYADLFTLDADGLFNSFKTGSADYTATIARVKEAYAIYAAFSDTAKESLETEGAKLEDLLGVEKKASAYMGNDININFEDGLPASSHIDLKTDYASTTTYNRQYLSVVANPSADSGNNSANVVSLASDPDGNIEMVHKIKFTDSHSTNYLNTVSFKMYYPSVHSNDGRVTKIYLNYNESADISKTDFLAFYSDGTTAPLQFYVKQYDAENSKWRDNQWSNPIKVNGTTDSIGTMQGQWYTVNMTYTATGVDITVVNSNGQSSKVYNVKTNGSTNVNSIAIGRPNRAGAAYYDDFKVTFRSPYTMSMTNGAWLRDNDPTGIRFGAQNVAANELYGAADCTVVAAGALFMPYDKLEDGEQLTIERVDVKNANGAKALKAESRTDTMPKSIYGVLSNVIENDKIKKDRDFVCRTYIKYTKAGDPDGVYRYAYADADNAKMSRSLEYVVFACAEEKTGTKFTVYNDAINALKKAGYLGGNK